MLTTAAIKTQARATGFDVCGVASALAYPELRYFHRWLAAGYGGDMRYLERSAERRADVRAVLPTARSVVVVGTCYNVDRPYSTELADRGVARIARYAWGDDYHFVLERRLEALLDWMRANHPTPIEARAYVDTGPIQERVYAQYAGVGWIGKNTCLINETLGSWLFLSEIVCDLVLEPDAPGLDRCGECTLCMEACPTGALREPLVLDATRCISYLTIERRGQMPEELRGAIGAHVYGCDVCQEVCPWNATPPISLDPSWQPRPAFDRPSVAELARRSDAELRAALKGSAMKRAGVAGLRRNIEVARTNLSREPFRDA
jgi:epoxyqueuosine reductase